MTEWASRQLLEVESLQAVYFEDGAVRVDEAETDGIASKTPLAMSVRLPLESSGGLRLAAVLPHGYPGEGEGPTIWLEPEFDVAADQSSSLSARRAALASLADDDDLCSELQTAADELAAAGEECLLPLVQQAVDLIEARLRKSEDFTETTATDDDESLALALFQEELSVRQAACEGKASGSRAQVLGRRAMFSHHIIANSKRQAIRDWAIQLGLGGLAKVGWPGAIIVEGDEQGVRAYVDALTRLRWKHFVVRGEEIVDVPPGQSLQELRCLPEGSFQEFGPDGGMSEFATCCRQVGFEELFLRCLKLEGSGSNGRKAQAKEGEQKSKMTAPKMGRRR
eukprot:TRINITY_DN61518_c0_g1_i1.p1 TRINITY_DN61518_c0_g1~~TRINITY_DN61518_c0_g1_i1.p1  ORF type:complete len:339 (+),score=90.02 TRINITY_DN61518_c0_g1_i1:84-1100(+)